ncbi:MAG: Protein translocase membrane subunit SecG, partial [uncultured Nocardioidaceae bacterium]
DHRTAHHPSLRDPGADRGGAAPAQRRRGPRHRLLPRHGLLHDGARHGQPPHARNGRPRRRVFRAVLVARLPVARHRPAPFHPRRPRPQHARGAERARHPRAARRADQL